MKLPYPTRVPIFYAMSFAAVLFMVELVEGTPIGLCVTVMAYIFVATLTFNEAGGLNYPSGGYVFFNVLLTVLLGLVTKAVLGEAVQSNVFNAQKTMLVYLIGQIAMMVAIFATRRATSAKGLLEGVLTNAPIGQVGFGCLLLGVVPAYLLTGGIATAFAQLNYFVIIAILIPVYVRVVRSGGEKSFNVPSFVAWAFFTVVWGLFVFSKFGIFAPSTAWIIACAAGGYRISIARAAILAGVAAVAFAVLTPYSQVGRGTLGSDRYATAGAAVWDLLTHPLRTREFYYASLANDSLVANFGYYHWFDQPQGILDRLNMFAVDDALIHITDNGETGSLAAVWSYFPNAVPRFLYPSKPNIHWGNVYGIKLGMLATEDETTGISFSPFADAYHTGQWIGVTLVMTLMMVLCFTVMDSITGPIARSPWGLFFIFSCAHFAPEGMLGALVILPTATSLGLVMVAYMSVKAAPIIGGLVSTPEKRLLRRT